MWNISYTNSRTVTFECADRGTHFHTYGWQDVYCSYFDPSSARWSVPRPFSWKFSYFTENMIFTLETYKVNGVRQHLYDVISMNKRNTLPHFLAYLPNWWKCWQEIQYFVSFCNDLWVIVEQSGTNFILISPVRFEWQCTAKKFNWREKQLWVIPISLMKGVSFF